MSMALGNINLLSIVYRTTEAVARKESTRPTETCKNFVPVQIVNRFNKIQGKGVSDDQ